MRFVALVASLLVATAAQAGSPPKLDINATCRRAQPLSGGEKSAFRGCVDDERQAQKELAKLWSSFKASAQSNCLEVTRIGGAPSYVELVTCLQLDKQAQEASRENKKSLDLPGGPSSTRGTGSTAD
ncbi:MAG: hypothetical protein JO357_14165 [Hyphomicrobiales bacterium]|nr:hypothetical protein [Hyphomicrobiales bacterium]